MGVEKGRYIQHSRVDFKAKDKGERYGKGGVFFLQKGACYLLRVKRRLTSFKNWGGTTSVMAEGSS